MANKRGAWAVLLFLVALFGAGCEKPGNTIIIINETDGNTDTSSDADADSDGDSDSSADTNGDTDGDSDGDTEDTDSDVPDAGPIIPDCTGCEAVGASIDHMRCAIDMCDDAAFESQTYTSPTEAPITDTFRAMARYGDSTNHLAPKLYDAYAVMTSGTAISTDHDIQIAPDASMGDPYSQEGYPIYDVMEWQLRLKAPKNAQGIQITYVFFSAEYDEYVNTSYNDKFYIFLTAPVTTNNVKTVINFTRCRDPDQYYDTTCTEAQALIGACEEGEPLCYIAINTAFSECCWYNDCPDGTATTDISGTGFSCAPDQAAETHPNGSANPDLGKAYGSSSGWMVTKWPIRSEEVFDLTFHIHDTFDARLDSAVIIDQVLFIIGPVDSGTNPI
ncbi:MAG: choice-of-anchor L domain-containing protein [Myxococcota bacterium]|nr:choice-of-anchor L domain-containing protein [Myxococcota bacterium]